MWTESDKSAGAGQPKSRLKSADLFRKFCETSTIHGTFFWSESSSLIGKLFWVVVVVVGLVGSVWIIDNQFKAWASNPVITAVEQIKIEEVPFPAIVICPKEKTKYGYVEKELNNDLESQEKVLSRLSLDQLFYDIVLVLRANIEPDPCLNRYCLDDSTSCPDLPSFQAFAANYSSNGRLSNELANLMRNLASTEVDINQLQWTTTEDVNCRKKAQDYQLFRKLAEYFPDGFSKQNIKKPGSLLRWLFVQAADEDEQRRLYSKYLGTEKKYTTQSLGVLDDFAEHLPDVVSSLSSFVAGKKSHESMTDTSSLFFDTKLLEIMKGSTQANHMVEEKAYVPGSAFPFCHFDRQTKENSGESFGPYNEKYCNAFQTTINEEGLCYTFNNFNLGTSGISDEDKIFTVQKVPGCGKSKGFRVVVDSQRLAYKSKKLYSQVQQEKGGFRVFITVPGVVTHKVPFDIDPSYSGEYDFLLHGLHVVDADQGFLDWNKEAKVCYLPTNDKNLTFYPNHYSQDNCLLECKMKKIAEKCGCSPWFVNQQDLKLCNEVGNACVQNSLNIYTDDLTDRQECDCRSDCGGIHFFATEKQRVYDGNTQADPKVYFHHENGKSSGMLENYLEDPGFVFTDEMTSNLTQLMYGKNRSQLAMDRFKNDITILNFFFDTPIITRITLKMRINIFDQISAIGGTLGLFTGVSLITFVEVIYWLIRFPSNYLSAEKGFAKDNLVKSLDNDIIRKKSLSSVEVSSTLGPKYNFT